MNNRVIKILGVLLVIVCLTSCFNNEKEQNDESINTAITNVHDEKNTIINNTRIKEDLKEKDEQIDNVGVRLSEYDIVSEVYKEEGDAMRVCIEYPQITGLYDEGKQKEVNKLLKDEALKILKYYNDFKEQYLDLNVKYYISLKSEYILSIKYIGLGELEMSPHPDKIFYTTNLDFTNGKRLRLCDFVNINEQLVNTLYYAEFTPIAAPDEVYVIKEHDTYENATRSFLNADNMEDRSLVFSYFTDGAIVISIPVFYALGGSAEFEIKYHDLTKYLSENSTGVKDLMYLKLTY